MIRRLLAALIGGRRGRELARLARECPPAVVSEATLPPGSLLVTDETTPRDINEALLFGRPVYWVPEHNALRFDAPTPIPDSWREVGFTREAAETHAAWMRETFQHISLSLRWAPPAALGVPTPEPWPPEPPKPVLEHTRLSDAAVKGSPAVPTPPESAVRPTFQPEPWQYDAWRESKALHDHIGRLLAAAVAGQGRISGHEHATQADDGRKVGP